MNRSTTNRAQSKAEKIASIVQKIAESGQSVNEYFLTHKVPFSRVQYFRNKARLPAQGILGINDERSRDNQRKLTPETENFLRLRHQENPELSLQELCLSLATVLSIEVGRSTARRLLQTGGRSDRLAAAPGAGTGDNGGGRFRNCGCAGFASGWVEHSSELIEPAPAGFRRTAIYRHERVSEDRKGRQGGRFTAAYNERADVRATLRLGGREAGKQEPLAHGAAPDDPFHCRAEMPGDSGAAPGDSQWRHSIGQRSPGQYARALLSL
jgi:hypothetical protein